MKILFIRHGLTAGNLEKRYIGRFDELLCEEGMAQLKTMNLLQCETVVCSSMKRCIQTAEILFPNYKYIASDELRECDFGDFEGKTADDLADDPAYKEWLIGGADACPPGGEGNSAFSQRVTAGFVKIVDGLISSGIHSAGIVTHGGVIMAILAAFGLPQQPMSAWLTPPGCGYTLLVNPGVWASHRKVEVYLDIPERPLTDDEERELWDWYPSEN